MQRKLTKQFLSLLLIFVMILQSTFGVFAKSVTLDRLTAMSSYLTVKEHTDNLGAHHDEQGKRVFKIDGQYAYCIESDVGLSQDQIYQDGHSPQDILEKGKQNILTDWKEKYQMISALLTLVPSTISTNSKTEHIHWLVGQTMIWEITGEERDWDFTYKGPTRAGAMAYRDPFKWVYAADKAEFDRFYKEIEQKMLTYWKLPSFTNPVLDQTSTFDLNQFDGTYYYTTLTDTNNVLSNFDFHADGFEFSIKDNVLKVMTKNSTTTSVTINTLPSRELTMRSPLFWADGAFQKTVTAGEVEDASPFAYFKVKVAVGNLKIVKKDNKDNFIPNTSFTISYHADMTQPIGIYTTGEDGTVTLNGLTAQNVYIQETAVPNHLVLDTTIQSILVEPSKTVTFTKMNLQKGHLTIAKQDNKGNYIPDVEFKVSYNEDMTNAIGKFKTDNHGKIYLTNLHLGTIYVQEISVPSHLILDHTVHELKIKTGETTSYTQVNKWKQGYIQVAKKDADTNKIVKIAGTKFDILDQSDKVIETITTDETGIAKSELLDYGTYDVKETLAPNGYTIQIAVSDDIEVIENNKTYSIVISNQRVSGTLNLSKQDSKTGQLPQGNATLEGAVYGVFAKNDIVDPSHDGTVLYKAGTKITELTTDNKANATAKNLYLGDYYVQELIPSYGYNKDESKYDFSLTYENQNVNVVTQNVTVLERVISQAFSIIKISSEETGETDLLAGAEFTIKSQADVNQFGWDNAPIAKNADGKEAKVLVTDSRGYAVSQRLPIGTYVVRETKTPDNKYTVQDFTVVVDVDSSEPQPYRIFNDKSFLSVLSIVKEDAKTGKIVKVEGAKFKVKNLETHEYYGYWEWFPLPHYVSSWTTDETGTVMIGEMLKYGNYQLEEIASPNGYLLSKDPVPFTISSNAAYQVLPDGKTPVITVNMTDVSVKGQITVEKQGEKLAQYKDEQFVYKLCGMAGAKFNVIAKNDILDPSHDGTVLFKKGTVVETLTTGTNGKATSKQLPLGTYEVEEIEAPHGMIINGEKQTVVLKYADDKTPVVFEHTSFVNDRQKVSAQLFKADSVENTKGLKGAEFNFIAVEDVFNDDGEVIVKAGTLIGHYISDNYGNIVIDKDLPVDYAWQLVETKAPIGYIIDRTPVEFTTDYLGQAVKTINIAKVKFNERTKADFSKTDITTSKELAGNILTIFEKGNEGATFTTWISGDKPHTVENLPVNTRLIMRETSSVKGFSLANDIEFEFNEYGNAFVFDKDGNRLPAKNNLIVMENDLVTGQLVWNKTGEIFTHTDIVQSEFGVAEEPVWEKSNILQSEITIYAGEDITLGNGVTYYVKDEKIQTLESDWDTVKSKELLVGQYYYVETKTPHGYITDTDKHCFEIKDSQSSKLQVVQSTLKNERPRVIVEFTKFMENFSYHNKVNNAYRDVLFGIYAREDIYTYKGSVGIEHDTLIATTGIDELGQLDHMPDLPNGTYYLKELQTNKDYVLDTNEYDFEIAYHGQDVSTYKVIIGEALVENKLIRGTVEIKKHDSFDEKVILKDVEFNISINKDMKDVIATVKTDKNGIARFEDLEIGKYYIQEAQQVNGYVLNDYIYAMEVKINGELLTIDVNNTPTQMIFSKVDETGCNELEGAVIEIVDYETGKAVERWTSGKVPHKIRYLVEGKKYIMREITAPYGYDKAEEIVFIAGDGYKATMNDEPILTAIQIKKIDSATHKVIQSKDFAFTMYADEGCTQPLRTMYANQKDGTATFYNVRFGTYYIKETKAPEGYQLSHKVKKIVVDENLEGVGDVHSFVYENTLLPVEIVNTDDNSLAIVFLGMGMISLIGMILLNKKRAR